MPFVLTQKQIILSDAAFAIIQKHKLVYIASQERTGKTLISLAVAEKLMNSSTVKNVLIISTKKALDGLLFDVEGGSE